MNYFEHIRNRMPHFFDSVSVLEYVPHSRCKSILYLFENSHYVVVDALRHDLSDVPSDSYTVAMSIDFLHRAPNYLEIFTELHRVSSKFVMLSCATAGMPPKAAGYWKNITQSDFSVNLDEMFDTHRFHVDYDQHQLYFWGVKRNEV